MRLSSKPDKSGLLHGVCSLVKWRDYAKKSSRRVTRGPRGFSQAARYSLSARLKFVSRELVALLFNSEPLRGGRVARGFRNGPGQRGPCSAGLWSAHGDFTAGCSVNVMVLAPVRFLHLAKNRGSARRFPESYGDGRSRGGQGDGEGSASGSGEHVPRWPLPGCGLRDMARGVDSSLPGPLRRRHILNVQPQLDGLPRVRPHSGASLSLTEEDALTPAAARTALEDVAVAQRDTPAAKGQTP